MDIYLALTGLILSFFFAGSEAAFTNFNKLRLEVWERQGRRLAVNAKLFVNKPENFFSTILIGNNFANILYTTFATVIFINYFDEGVSGIFILMIVLFIGEILPKTLFRSLANVLILEVLLVVRFFYVLFRPAIQFINFLTELLLQAFKISHKPIKTFFSRDEMEMMLRENQLVMNESEFNYIEKVLHFNEEKVSAAMTPRTEIVAADINSTWEDVINKMIEGNSSYVIIFNNDLDNIVGVVFAFDIMEPFERLEEVIHSVMYVPENKNCSELMQEFQNKKTSIALVVDEYGGTAGVVSSEELIEEVFGDFFQPEEETPFIRALNDRTWLIDARFELDELGQQLDVDFPEGDFETLAGLILAETGRFPKTDEVITFDQFKIQIVKSSSNQINLVKFIKSNS